MVDVRKLAFSMTTALLLSFPAAYCLDASTTAAILLNNEGVGFLNQKNFEGAINRFGAALQADPNYPLAKANLAIALNNYAIELASKSQHQQALEWFEHSLYITPDNVTTGKNLRQTISTIGMNPDSFADRVKLGDLAYTARRAPGAIIEFKAALAIKDDAEVYRKLSAAMRNDFTLGAPSRDNITLVTTSGAGGALSPDADRIISGAAGAQSASSQIEDKWAIVIGVSKFRKPALNLKYPAKDAQDLYNYLLKEGNFAADHVKLVVDEQATKERLLDEVGDKWLPRLAHPNDLVLIFISSHGSPSNLDLEGLNYLIMHDTDPDRLYSTGLPMQDLANAIRSRVHAKRVVIILDACHSGAANPAKGLNRAGNFNGDVLSQGTGQLVICSSEPSQVSWESARYQNGVFTHQLIEALRSNSGKVKLGQAFDHMKESVLSEVLQDRKEVQSPVLKTQWKGEELILSTPPAKPRPVPKEMLNQ